jgi:DNA (cytosine-5)-methyltransferase 1
MDKLIALSLFANVGVGETYLKDLGIHTAVANELLLDRSQLYKHFHPDSEVVQGDITKPEIFDNIIQLSKDAKVNLIIATPPCQGMSIAGHMNPNDPRNTLIIKAMEAFNLLKPDYMLIENVPQMLKTSILYNGQTINIQDFIIQQVGSDYNVVCKIFDAADFNTPQYRKRTIVRIFKKGLEWNEPIKQKHITVRDAIFDLPTLESNQISNLQHHYTKKHNDNHLLWMKHTPTGKSAFSNLVHYPQKDGRRIKGFATTYKRIEWDKPAPTITMGNGSISSQNNVHPGHKKDDGTYSDARVLTPLELFRLMGLPDNWNFPKELNNKPLSENTLRHVIGEAVPPRMMEAMFKPLFNKS